MRTELNKNRKINWLFLTFPCLCFVSSTCIDTSCWHVSTFKTRGPPPPSQISTTSRPRPSRSHAAGDGPPAGDGLILECRSRWSRPRPSAELRRPTGRRRRRTRSCSAACSSRPPPTPETPTPIQATSESGDCSSTARPSPALDRER